jgi:tricarballylate dehydrogenase
MKRCHRYWKVTESLTSYPHGINVKVDGERFSDESEDNVGKTYARTGKKIVDQPEARAHQIFDQQTVGLLTSRYKTSTPIHTDAIEELAKNMGVDVGLSRTIALFDAACLVEDRDKFEPTKLDGVCTRRPTL